MNSLRTVVFVCEHGAAKSVIAAALLERLASEHGEPVRALARGTEPDPAISPAAAAGLRADGIDVRGWKPRKITRSDLAAASQVVSFGPDLTSLLLAGATAEQWPGVPPIANGYSAARVAILAGLPSLLAGGRDG